MMQRMGMNMDSVSDVQQVIIRTSSKDIVIDDPEVAILEVQGQKMYQVIGGQVSEQAPTRTKSTATAQTHFPKKMYSWLRTKQVESLEKAKEALEEADGDLAKAILLLQS